MTVAYLRDTADQAGLNTVGMTVEQIGFDHDRRRFVDHEGRLIETCFKLYPWEDMVTDEFGERLLADPDSTRWIEPLWKVLLSNKALLAALWHLYPGHENLIPAYLDRPWGMDSWIDKPLHGREGDGMRYVLDGTEHRTAAPALRRGGLLLPAVGAAAGLRRQPTPCSGPGSSTATPPALGIRESDGPITDYYARFVPHYIDAPTPGAKTSGRPGCARTASRPRTSPCWYEPARRGGLPRRRHRAAGAGRVRRRPADPGPAGRRT